MILLYQGKLDQLESYEILVNPYIDIKESILIKVSKN